MLGGGIINAAIGGSISEITGGDFANGAAMGAMQYAFNQLAQENNRREPKQEELERLEGLTQEENSTVVLGFHQRMDREHAWVSMSVLKFDGWLPTIVANHTFGHWAASYASRDGLRINSPSELYMDIEIEREQRPSLSVYRGISVSQAKAFFSAIRSKTWKYWAPTSNCNTFATETYNSFNTEPMDNRNFLGIHTKGAYRGSLQ